MRIYKMTATFGKLEHQTLTLEPGLNIITAPNEWGKSTWCAFLLAMLYGLDTRAKSTKTALADKDRYAPWSGSPMEGRMDLNWKGRDITIQRKTRGRVPMGEFTAFETASGIPVPELTAANCGQQLLGVEETVFRRSGFIRHADLPVTQDEALRRRLNALVTTGDESGAGDRLADSLRELKNRCRYNRTGLLPQAEAQRETLENKLAELEALDGQCRKLKIRLDEIKTWQSQLRNHQQALDYAAAEASAGRMAQARDLRDRAEQELRSLEAACAKLPSREEADQKLRDLRAFRDQWNAIQLEKQMLPQAPELPRLAPPFEGMPLEDAQHMVQTDSKAYHAMIASKAPLVLMIAGLLGFIGGVFLMLMKIYLPGAITLGAALAAIAWGFYERSDLRRQALALIKKYGSAHTDRWAGPLEEHKLRLKVYQSERKAYQESSGDLEVRYMVLQRKRDALCGAQNPEAVLELWQQVLAQWDAYHDARREAIRAQSHFDTLAAVVKPVGRPSQSDALSYSEAETARLLSDALTEQQRLQNRLGQHQGRMESLGDKAELQKELQQCSRRIARLEETYSALTIAMETLADARAELQRRFAPRITRGAKELLAAMTDGRYHSLSIGTDFSLQASAGEESALRELMWRSDGTMDQLYLALRLAVAQELTPEIPLVLDDALVRFDDTRVKAAVNILKELSQTRQILCFTCQSREERV